jgi:hypothetical protein
VAVAVAVAVAVGLVLYVEIACLCVAVRARARGGKDMPATIPEQEEDNIIALIFFLSHTSEPVR